MSACCRPERRRRRAGGFTLLEMVVVMALFALISGLAIPRLTTLRERIEAASQLDEVMSRIRALGPAAFRSGTVIELADWPSGRRSDPLAATLQLPEGWTIHADPPLRFLASGVCLGGPVELHNGDRLYSFRLLPPFCRSEAM